METTTEFLPPALIFGCHKPDLRLQLEKGRQVVFCFNNETLHLTPADLNDGTYETGALLGALCRKHCLPHRHSQPCPAFAKRYRVGAKQWAGLAEVELHDTPQWDLCPGVRKFLEVEMTAEEVYLLREYLDDRWYDESQWREHLVAQWSQSWHRVEDLFGTLSRAGRFDQMLWRTLRYPALIPQVWLNWLWLAPEALAKTLEQGRASRVDFVAFAHGERRVIEIDGPSHYGMWDESSRTYSPDEREYARNLKIERWLRAEGWTMTRIGRHEVREAMADDDMFDRMALMRLLPFTLSSHYPEQLSAMYMCCEEIDLALDELPF